MDILILETMATAADSTMEETLTTEATTTTTTIIIIIMEGTIITVETLVVAEAITREVIIMEETTIVEEITNEDSETGIPMVRMKQDLTDGVTGTTTDVTITKEDGTVTVVTGMEGTVIPGIIDSTATAMDHTVVRTDQDMNEMDSMAVDRAEDLEIEKVNTKIICVFVSSWLKYNTFFLNNDD